MKKDYSNYILILLLFFVLYLFKDLFSGIKDFLGIGSLDSENKAAIALLEKAGVKNPFDISFLENVRQQNPTKSVHLLKAATAESLAEQIEGAAGFWHITDQTHLIKEAFDQINYRTQVSQLADVFSRKYGRDLLSFIKTDISAYGSTSSSKHAEVIDGIIRRVNSLPLF